MDLDAALRDALGREAEPAYLLDRQGHLLFLNDAWDRAARACGAPAAAHAERMVGRHWLEGVSGKVRRYYAALVARAFAIPQSEPAHALVHLSESNSPDRVRVVAHRFVPLFSPVDDEARWLLVVHSPVVESEVAQRYVVVEAAAHRYLDAEGHVSQCSSCRRVRVRAEPDAGWEFVPELVQAPPPRTAWRVCGACRERYFIRPAEEPLKQAQAAKLPRSAGLWLSARMMPLVLSQPG